MEQLGFFAVTVALGCAGGWIGRKLRLPAGALVGAMIAVGLFNISLGKAEFYTVARVILQLFSGAMVGSRIGPSELKSMKAMVPSVVILILSLLLLNLTFAFLMSRLSTLSPATALFATAPGGASDMSIICADFGGDAGIVAILQVARLIMIYLFIPPLIRYFDRRNPAQQAAHTEVLSTPEPEGTRGKDFLCMMLCAAAGGLALHFLKVSAGAMIGAMIGSGAYCVLRGRQRYPARLKTGLQYFSGAYIGARIGRSLVERFVDLLIPLAIMLVGIFAFVFLTSFAIRKLSHVDRSTAMLISTPGGIQEMSLLSEELGADTPKVAVLHTVRLVSVILLFPYVIQLLLKLLG